MSAIHCSVCNGSNPPGSKFCNNCGSPLPPETHIVCPNCQHFNSLHLMYCDYCGTRLVHEDSAVEPSLPERELPPAPKAFDLPTRAADDTSELKIPPLRQPAIHDWLKDDALEDAAPAASPPEPSPAAPEPQEPEGDPTDPAFADFARWLQDIRVAEETPQPDEAGPPPTSPPAAAELTNWLAANEEIASPRDDLPDWLRAAAPRGTGILSTSTSDAFSSTPPSPELNPASDVPDWLAKMAPPGTGMLTGRGSLDEEDIFDALRADFEVPDWLRPTDTPPEDKVVLPAPSRQVAEKETSAPLPPEETSDWLTPLADAESDFTPPETAAADALPDWLAELEAEAPTLPPEMELPDWLAPAATEAAGSAEPPLRLDEQEEEASDSFQANLLAAGQTANDDFPDWLPEREEAAADTAAEESDEPAAGLTFTPASLAEDLPDWFDVLFRDEARDEIEIAAGDRAESLPDWLTEFADEAILTAAAAATAADAESIDIAQPEANELEQAEAADLAGWLNRLPAAQRLAAFDADLGLVDLADDEWLEEAGSAAESAAPQSEQTLAAEDELASADLPEWLQDSLRRATNAADAPSLADLFGPPESAEMPAGDKTADLPDWLQPPDADSFDAALQAALSSRDVTGPTFGTGDEWSDVLGETPAAFPDIELPSAGEFAGLNAAANELIAADIPEWLQPFKPHELRHPGEIYPSAEPVQETGPLAGMRGVIDIEPIIAQPRQAGSDLPQFTITPTQRQQASLLRQLAQAAPSAVMTADAVRTPGMSMWLRLLLAALLLAALVAGILLPNLANSLVGAAEASLPAAAAAANDAIQAAAGQPVLVAFDYTPAMSGELGPPAQLLLAQLAANGSPVLTISQSAAGVTLAEQAMGRTADLNGTNLGYLPGEAVGLRLLGQCVAAPDSCQTIAGNPLLLTTPTAPVSLVILLTADQENLINWVEQVGSASQTPLLAVVTQSLAPAAGPYFASGQLAGLIAGLPAAAAYERQITGAAGAAAALHQTQGLAYWLVILLLIGGNLFYLAAGLLARRRRQ